MLLGATVTFVITRGASFETDAVLSQTASGAITLRLVIISSSIQNILDHSSEFPLICVALLFPSLSLLFRFRLWRSKFFDGVNSFDGQNTELRGPYWAFRLF